MSRVAVFIFLLLIVDVLGSDANTTCFQMGDEDYYGTVRKHEINCFTLPVHSHKINFTIKAPDDGKLTLYINICNITMRDSYRIEPNTTRTITLNYNDLLEEICIDGKRLVEIEGEIMLRDDSASSSFQIINNNKIGIYTHTFLFIAHVTGAIIYFLSVILIVVYVCPLLEEETPRVDEMDTLNRPDEVEMDNLNRPDEVEMDNLNRSDELEMDNLNRPDEVEMDNLNRSDELEMDNLNRPEGTEMDDLNNTPNNNLNNN